MGKNHFSKSEFYVQIRFWKSYFVFINMNITNKETAAESPDYAAVIKYKAKNFILISPSPPF